MSCRRAPSRTAIFSVAAVATLLLSCSGQDPVSSADRSTRSSVVEHAWDFTGGHDLVDFHGPDLETPWLGLGSWLGTGYDIAYRFRLTTPARDWSWPVGLRATAPDLVAGEPAIIALEGLPGTGTFSNGWMVGAYYRIRARVLGETIIDSGWLAIEEQGLRAAGSGPAPLAGTTRIPADVCVNIGVIPKLGWVPSWIELPTFNACLVDLIEGRPLRVGVSALADLAPPTPGHAELGAAPAELTIVPTGGHPRFRVLAEDWIVTLSDHVSYQIRAIDRTLFEVLDVEYLRSDEAFSADPWPPFGGSGYHGGPPTPAIFEFTARPGISRVSPVNGPMAGGTLVRLTGGAFEEATQVCFGDRCVASDGFEVVSDAEIRVASPPMPDGSEAITVFVTVTAPTGTSPERDHARFRYLPRPRVTGLEPAWGIATGGTPVAVAGRGFTTTSGVDFGPWAASYAVASDERIDAVAPAGAGRVHVRVTTACEEPPPLEETRATSCGTSPEGPEDLYTWVSLVVLEPEEPLAVLLDGGASVDAGGAAWIDSTSAEAVRAVGNGWLRADPEIGLVGGASLSGKAALAPAPLLGVEPRPDPLAFAGQLDTSTLPVRDGPLRLTKGSVELQPGIHDGGTVLGGTADVRLAPGVHVFRGGLSLQGGARVTGDDDVLLVLEPGPDGSSCSLDLQGQGALQLGAPRRTELPGVSVEVSPACAARAVVGVAGAGSLLVEGAIHAPGATFRGAGGQLVRAGALVADRLDLRGGEALLLRATLPAGVATTP